MILLDTDTLTLLQAGHLKVTERVTSASEVPKITLVTQIEALRGRHDAVLKAEEGARLLRAQQNLIRTVNYLALFEVISFDEAAALEFDSLHRPRA